jgi:hypothetical protein|tara:strand:- start:400 stop:837 length:438 start_codon:yes stop_codon:yes gene_type:complete
MAITSAVCNSFKQEVLVGTHNFTATTGHTFKIALFTSSASLGAGTTAYSTSNEITNSSGTAYQPGGASLTSVTPTLDSSTAVCDFNDVSFSSASFTANGALIYNDTQSDKAVAVIAFGGDKTVSSGTFTIQFPAADATNAIIRLA